MTATSLLTTAVLAVVLPAHHPVVPMQLHSGLRASRATLPCMSHAGALRRLTVGVEDAASCAKFYTEGLGLASSESAAGSTLVGGSSGPKLELREAAGSGFKAGGGFQGLSLRVPSVAGAVAAATACGGTVLSEPEIIEHGPCWKPVEEPDEQRNDILEAVVADPSGYPVLLHEAEGASASISGVRCECHVWKESQDWYESLGWHMQRYNANVHREASLTVSLGTEGGVCGPRGGDEGAVVQLMYRYGSSKVSHASGLEAIVLDAGTRVLVGDAGSEELSDPDGYVVRLEKSAAEATEEAAANKAAEEAAKAKAAEEAAAAKAAEEAKAAKAAEEAAAAKAAEEAAAAKAAEEAAAAKAAEEAAAAKAAEEAAAKAAAEAAAKKAAEEAAAKAAAEAAAKAAEEEAARKAAEQATAPPGFEWGETY